MSVSKVTSRISPRQFGLKQNGTSSHFDPDILSRFVVCVFLCPKMSPHHLGSLVFLHWKYLNIWDLSVLKIGVGHIPCMLDVGYFSPRSTYISGVLRTENPHLLRASFTRTRLTAVDVFFLLVQWVLWCDGSIFDSSGSQENYWHKLEPENQPRWKGNSLFKAWFFGSMLVLGISLSILRCLQVAQ